MLNNLLKKTAVLALVTATSVLSISTANADQMSTLERIKQTKVLKLGVIEGEPWYNKDPITGKWDGVGYRLGVLIAKDLGAKVVPEETTYGNAPAAIQSGQADLVLVLDATKEREKAIDFPKAPLLYYQEGILMRDGLPIKTWQDLNSSKYRIGTALGTSVDRDITKRLPKAHISRYANTNETVAAFMSGRIDGLAFFYPALAIAKSKIRMGQLIIPTPEINLSTSGGVRKGDTAFKNFVNAEFIKLMKNGNTQRVFTEYLESKGLSKNEIPSIQQ